MTKGRLLGIARKARPRGDVETIDHATIGIDTGIAGDFRGTIRPGKSGRRQITILSAEDWKVATAGLGLSLDWSVRRANLLVEGIALPRVPGARLRIGSAVLEITGECDPCSRMEEIATGLKAVLTPEWRGGRTARVIAGGNLCVGDEISIEEA
ncbi:MOSC domain-containing protein [Sphingomonas oleivorans]|uniref:MOSC domain-containing protein n=1 Tax=Sphingomonas oleivorans TaxID=1735121 RepID=A0A2T5FYQ6_9SPHN|nr:MOSC domain-containing protein [Sphingomonas oleivorans]PTQ11652.1 MOSC domain-containing protein [Sphingomonas oleivorans]